MKKETKEIMIGFVAMVLIVVTGIILINARFNNLCESGYTNYCSVE